MAFGIFALAVKGLSAETTSAIFIVLGVIGLYINLYDHKKSSYEQSGVALTKIYNELKSLYFKVKSLEEDAEFSELQKEFSELESRYYPACISKQILFSNWYAHYKFYWEHQIDWVNEQLNFNFFRDKIPLSLWLTMLTVITGLIWSLSDIAALVCNISKP